MKWIKRVKAPAIIALVMALTLNADTAVKPKKAISQIQKLQTAPVTNNLDLPPGPRTGQYYLTGATSGFANGVHNLGLIKKGQTITIFVEGLTTGFDPTVIITAPNWAQHDLIVWQADDTSSDPDPSFSIVAPVTGVYTMLVAEYAQRPGWYRYSIEIH